MSTNTARKEEANFENVTGNQFASMRNLLDQLESRARDAASSDAAPPAAATVTVTRQNRQRKEQPKMTTTPSNAPTFESLIERAVELGTQVGNATDAQIKFALTVTSGAYLGTLTLDENKHGDKVDDAQKLGEAYFTARNKNVAFDAKAPNQRKLISTLRKCVKLGGNPKWGAGEPMQTVNTLMTNWQKARKEPANKGRLDDAMNCLMRFATAQLKHDVMFPEDDLKQFIFKKGSEPRSAEDVLEGIRKLANKLKIGKVANCPDLDNSKEVQEIINNCTKRLVAIAKARAPNGAPASTP